MGTAYKGSMSDEGLRPVPDDLDFGQTIRGYAPGQKLFGRYVLSQIIGRGGMGLVWLAQDEKLEQRVALKFLPEQLRLDTSALDDLKRETRRGLALAHPHIVRIYDFVDDVNAAAISMEYIDGRTLSALRIEQQTRVYETPQLHEWTGQLVEALDYAHRRAKIVHRDLKPANLMTNLSGELKVADFGIARSISDSVSRVSVRGASAGTLVYMSPQQAQGQASKAADDIYAIGATFYELLTSKPPFFSGNIQHQLDTVVPPSMMERRAELEIESTEPIPEDWERTIAACLAKDPADRPQSVAQMGEWLGLRPPTTPSVIATAYATNGKTKASVTSASAGQPPSSNKTGLFIGLGVAALVALLIAGGLGYYFGVVVPADKAKQAEIAKQQADAAAEKAREDEAAKEKADADAAAALKAAQEKQANDEAAKAALEKAQADAAAQAAAAQKSAQEAQAALEKAQQAAAAAATPPPPPAPAAPTPEQIAHQNQVVSQVQTLINEKKLGSALYHLQLLTNSLDKDTATAISAPFQATLTPYQQQRDAAITASQTDDPADATTQLKAFAQQNPGDPKIEMALASIATRQPPSHAGLRDQLKKFKSLAAQDQAVATDPDFVALQAKFANELKQLDALASQLDALKASKNHGSLANLEAERTDAQKKLAAYQLIQPGSLFYMGVASSIQDKQREISNLTDKINAIRDHPAASDTDIDDAQQKYDDFVAAVPW